MFISLSIRPGRTARAALLAMGAMVWAGVAQAENASVSIDNFTFSPAEIVVTPGSTVTWTNADDIPHTVTATDKSFRSKPLDTNDHVSFAFPTPGTYSYFCSLHPHMTGKVIVKAP
jgi:plastocyanin